MKIACAAVALGIEAGACGIAYKAFRIFKCTATNRFLRFGFYCFFGFFGGFLVVFGQKTMVINHGY